MITRSTLTSSPAGLLLIVGGLLGLYFPLGKIARTAGVPSLLWAALIASGATLVLALLHVLSRRPSPLARPYPRYFAITATISYTLPNALVFAAIPHLGSGLTAIFYTLSPMITALLSSFAGLRAPSRLEYAGIAIGFAGALLVASTRGEVGRPAEWWWIAAGALIPFSLAAGNVYRTIAWPDGADPLWLATGSNAVSAVTLTALWLATGQLAEANSLIAIPFVAVLQVLSAAAMLFFHFRLQAVGGPVTLSQIGTVAAGVGVLIGSFLFGERYAFAAWAGVAILSAGIALTLTARLRG